MKKIILFMFLLLSINFVFAESIAETTINGEITNGKLTLTNSEYSGNVKDINLNVTNGTIVDLNFTFPIFFIRNETVEVGTLEKYIQCITDKGIIESEKNQFSMGHNQCLTNLNLCQTENNQSIKEKLTQCELNKQKVDLELSLRNSKISELEEENKGESNSKIIYIIIALVVGAAGKTFYDRGGIGTNTQDKSESEFNTQGVG